MKLTIKKSSIQEQISILSLSLHFILTLFTCQYLTNSRYRYARKFRRLLYFSHRIIDFSEGIVTYTYRNMDGKNGTINKEYWWFSMTGRKIRSEIQIDARKERKHSCRTNICNKKRRCFEKWRKKLESFLDLKRIGENECRSEDVKRSERHFHSESPTFLPARRRMVGVSGGSSNIYRVYSRKRILISAFCVHFLVQ